MRKFFRLVAAVGLLAMSQMSCSNPGDGGKDPPIPPTPSVSIAVATISADYTAANFEIISTEDYTASKNLIPGLFTDLAAIRAHGSDVYILERMSKDNVIKYSGAGIEYEHSMGTGLNIQDIVAVSPAKAYITAYQDTNLIVFNPTIGMQTSTISLARFNAYAGTDAAEAYPFASALAVNGDYVYVACQRLKKGQTPWGAGFVPGDTSLIAVIDTRKDTIVTYINLIKQNPVSMDVFDGKLLVSSAGDYFGDPSTGGVELIDLTTNTNTGLTADGSDFGGHLSNVIFVSADKAYVSANNANWEAEIFEINPAAKTVGAKIEGIVDGSGGFAYDGTKLYAGERGAAINGVVVINPSTNTVEQTIATDLPPVSLAIIRAD